MPEGRLNQKPHEKGHAVPDHSITRLSSGHSGLDYVESVRELSFFQGKFLRLLFTGQLRTRNPFYLALLFLGALLFPLGLLLAILTVRPPDPSAFWTAEFWSTMICGSLPMAAIGLACLATFTNSLEGIRRTGVSKGKR